MLASGVLAAIVISYTQSQLTLLASKMDEVADAVHKKDSDALLANRRFLEEKFGASPLALPQAGAAS